MHTLLLPSFAAWPAPQPAPGGVRLACRPTWLSPLAWLTLQALALWPHAAWVARRMADGSDDPLGAAALAALVLLLWRAAPGLRVAPATGALAVAALLTLAANAALFVWPPLPCALLAVLAATAALQAWLPVGAPRLALFGLLLLALPLVASLQYYAGYPLRAFTAQASALLLQLGGLAAEAQGAALRVQGRLVIVDAPCSGVQLAWLGEFAACAIAGVTGLRDAVFLRRLPAVGVLVLAGNVLRNSLLVSLEARPQGLAPGAHEAIGLAALAATVAVVVLWMSRGERHAAPR